jgi:hypothetical protein
MDISVKKKVEPKCVLCGTHEKIKSRDMLLDEKCELYADNKKLGTFVEFKNTVKMNTKTYLWVSAFVCDKCNQVVTFWTFLSKSADAAKFDVEHKKKLGVISAGRSLYLSVFAR